MRSPSRGSWFRPRVLILEDRLPMGEGVLGLLVGASLLPTDAAFATVIEPSGQPGVSTPRFAPVTGGFTPPVRRGELFAGVFSEGDDTASAWAAPLASARRQRDALTSPQRQQGMEPQPSLALRAGEIGPGPVPLPSLPAVSVTPRADDALLSLLTGLRQPATTAASGVTPAQEAQVKESYGKLPVAFEQNVGQTDAQVHFFTRGPGYGLFLTSTEAVMVLSPPRATAAVGQDSNTVGEGWQDRNPAPQKAEAPPAVVRMQLVGANAASAVTGREELPGKVNYFLGNDPSKWRTNVATFGRVEYDEVYPGIDLVWHGSNQQLEYDFVVAPGADPGPIGLRFAGAERVEVDAVGDLLVTAAGQTLRQQAPFVYQEAGGARRDVVSRFVLEGHEVRFALGAYDAARPLVIDPVLSYSTYLGGSNDRGNGIAVDPASGDALLTGYTQSTNFPTANPFQPSHGGGVCGPFPCADAFVARLSASGSALVYATYLGGSGEDSGLGIAVDAASGGALVTGYTSSTNFPTANPLQAVNRGFHDAFVVRLNPSGSALVYATYLGGSDREYGTGIAVDTANGDALLTGWTQSSNFPTANPVQAVNRGFSDAFVARLSPSGSALVYSTYLGGSSADIGWGLAVDLASGDALVTGDTQSPNFPTSNPLQAVNRGFSDVFVARLSATGSALVYSTYLGGSNGDSGRSIAVDPGSGNALLTGGTRSTDFPTANLLQPANRGDGDGFVARLNAAGSVLVYSTYLGGSSGEIGAGIAVDPASGEALVTGITLSTNFPTAHPLQAVNRGFNDVFVARLSAAGSALVYSTYLGGSSEDLGLGIAVDPASGDTLLTGYTWSSNFPTANPLQPGFGGGTFDGFATRIGSAPVAYYYVYPDSGQVTAGVPIDLYVFALDAQFSIIEDYTGLILFWATDPLATTPVYYEYQRTDRGIASFPGGLTLRTPGVQELYIFDWPGVQVFGYAAYQVV